MTTQDPYFTFVDPSKVVPHPDRPNIRSRTTNTTEIQVTAAEHGIQVPVIVEEGDEEGIFWLRDGARRTKAAQAIDLEKIPAIVVPRGTPEQVLVTMLLANIREPLPLLALENGRVNGGLVQAAHELAQDPDDLDAAPRSDPAEPNVVIATLLKETADAVGAMRRLWYEPAKLLERVQEGNLDLSVYSRMKSQPWDFKDAVIGDKGKVTMRKVMDALAAAREANQDALRDEFGLKDLDDDIDDSDIVEETIDDDIAAEEKEAAATQAALELSSGNGRVPAASTWQVVRFDPDDAEQVQLVMTQMIAQLNELKNFPFDPAEFELAVQLQAAVNELLEAQAV